MSKTILVKEDKYKGQQIIFIFPDPGIYSQMGHNIMIFASIASPTFEFLTVFCQLRETTHNYKKLITKWYIVLVKF